jgi:hypothetical protein
MSLIDVPSATGMANPGNSLVEQLVGATNITAQQVTALSPPGK